MTVCRGGKAMGRPAPSPRCKRRTAHGIGYEGMTDSEATEEAVREVYGWV
jgi:hypothetical protein